MRIDGNQAPQSLPESGRAGNPNAAGSETRSTTRSTTGSSALGEDQAQFSGVQGQVQALTEQVLQFPEIREAKVSALRQALLGGTYQPDSEQVADAVFAHMMVTPAA
jgi:flagellar biosynthesis anti-sigma factor FlgM